MSPAVRVQCELIMSRRSCAELAVLLLLAVSAVCAAPQKSNKQKNMASTSAPVTAVRQETNAAMASQIVHELKTLAQHHKLPAVIHQVTNEIPYGEEDYYDHELYKLEEDIQPTPDPAVSPAGFNVKGVLGLVEYLILLILLKGSVNHIAEKYFKSRGRRESRSSQEDLMGLAEEMTHHVTSHDLDQTFSNLHHLKHQRSKSNKNKHSKQY